MLNVLSELLAALLDEEITLDVLVYRSIETFLLGQLIDVFIR